MSEGAREVAGKAQEAVGERAAEAKRQAGAGLRSQLDSRSTEAGRQARSVAGALRRSSEEMEGEAGGRPREWVQRGADQVERLGGYLEQADADRILADVERFARRQPWLVGAGAFVLGVAASRFLKASSGDRYRASDDFRRSLGSGRGDGVSGPAGDLGADLAPRGGLVQPPRVEDDPVRRERSTASGPAAGAGREEW